MSLLIGMWRQQQKQQIKRCPIASFTRVNFKIRAPQVRVLDSNGNMVGVMSTGQAQRMADSQGLDLVEITPNATPPVCKIMDYGKFRYEESIKAKKARKSQKTQQVKEVKFHPGTDVADYTHKLKQIRGFLADGNKVKLTLQFRGRENAHKELGESMIERVLQDLAGECTVEQAPKTLGRVHSGLIGPFRGKKGAQQPQAQKSADGEVGADTDTPIAASPETPPPSNGITIKIG